MILGSISKSLVGVFQSACSCMKGSARRVFEAKAAIEFCGGSPRRAETIFGWNRKTIQRGLDELASGKPYSPSEERRGRLRAEAQNPNIVESTKSLIDDHSQTDPTFRSTLVYTRVTGQALRDALSEMLQVPISKLPTSRTMRRILNRNGYSQKKVRKTLPQKKIRQTDAIFENVNAAHLRATQDPTILQISIASRLKRTNGLEPWSVKIEPIRSS